MHGLDVTEDLMLVTAGVDRKISIWNWENGMRVMRLFLW